MEIIFLCVPWHTDVFQKVWGFKNSLMYFDVIYNSVSAWPAPKIAKLDKKTHTWRKISFTYIRAKHWSASWVCVRLWRKMLCTTQLVQFVTKEFLGWCHKFVWPDKGPKGFPRALLSTIFKHHSVQLYFPFCVMTAQSLNSTLTALSALVS